MIAEPSYNVEDIGLVNVAKEAISCGVKRSGCSIVNMCKMPKRQGRLWGSH